MKQIDYSKPIITAHRGASGLVERENSLEAFEKSIEVDSDNIECDIRRTKDNIIIINHNPDVEGMIIKDHTLDEINEATLKQGYKLPTLKEALKLIKGRIIIDIEIKEEGYEEEFLKETLSILNEDEFYIRSFFDNSIKKIKELNPKIVCTLLLGLENVKYGIFSRGNEFFPYKRVKRCKCDNVSPHYLLIQLFFCKRMHRHGVKVFAWTVNDEELMKKELKKGVDGLVTNYPDLAKKVVNDYLNKKRG